MTHTDIAMTVLSFAVVKTSDEPLWTGIHIWARKTTHWWRECVFVAIASALDCIPNLPVQNAPSAESKSSSGCDPERKSCRAPSAVAYLTASATGNLGTVDHASRAGRADRQRRFGPSLES
jgi:hypothetical protein